MAWFPRKDKTADEPSRSVPAPPPVATDDAPLRPIIRRPGVEEQQRIATGRRELEAEGVDIDDLAALGAGYDAAMSRWLGVSKRQREGHELIVERYAVGIGEHLARHTDLSWALVTDAFGTDLGLAGGKDEFVVVPSNLVASRWLNEESGWVPGVVGHLVRLRASR